jgi:hypothetical protein
MKSLIQTAEQVRAFIAGRRTRFCVPVKYEIPADADEVFFWSGDTVPIPGPPAPTGLWARRNSQYKDDTSGWIKFLGPAPYAPGERLFVKEAWDMWEPSRDCVMYQADGGSCIAKWRSPIHMPEWAARIFLTIKDCKAMQVQETTKWQAELEGCPECEECYDKCGQWGRGAIDDPLSNACGGRPWRVCYGICEGLTELQWMENAWDAQHGKRHPWSANPWKFAFNVEVEIK